LYIVPIFIPHKGCPFDCAFCNQNKITGVDDREISSDIIKEIINKNLSTMKRSNQIEVAFFGGSFTGLPIEYQEELLSSAHKYILEGKVNSIRISTRPDYIDKSILELLKKYGVKTIELGVQSMDNQVLRLSGRGHTQNDVEEASDLIKSYGFILGHQIMPGLPGDNYEKIMYTAEEIISIKPDILRIYPTIVIKGTKLEKMFLDNTYKPLELEEAVRICADLYSLFLSQSINVIRMGLQTTDDINFGGNIIAGPFHPSFGLMVKSKVFLSKIEEAIAKTERDSSILSILANEKSISEIIGLNKKNILYLKEKYGFDNIYIKKDSTISREEMLIEVE
jgi:histone acetyltransferase (RNA polymerase elongator complex component)